MKLDLAGIESTSAPDHSGIKWSPQQLGVFAAVEDPNRGSLRVDAVAGAGKTTTLIRACELMSGEVAFCAFNKRIADEIKSRVRHISGVQCGTLHAFGLRAWKQTAPNCEVDGEKLRNLCEDLRIPYWAQAFTTFMVGQAKSLAHKHPVGQLEWQLIADHFDAMDKLSEGWEARDDNDPFEYCNLLLKASIDDSFSVIDFDDMLYMPLCYGKIERRFDWILVDEAQDTNHVRRMLVEALLNEGGRVLVVGDEHQAIYGFTGADAEAMDRIQEAFQCERLPLTVTYRCPKVIVQHARQWVSHIEAAPEAPEGKLSYVSAVDFEKLGPSSFTPADVILCRNTKPLVTLALRLIRKNIGCRVEGRDIGQSLLTLVNRWKTANTLPKLVERLEEYKEKEVRKFLNRNQRAKAAQVEDKVDSLVAVIDSLNPGASLLDLRSRINSLFGDTQPGQAPRVCTLSTIHKAKGREWDRVYLLGREALMPSKYAKQEWELQQEKNLCYVAVTRAKKELVEVEYNG